VEIKKQELFKKTLSLYYSNIQTYKSLEEEEEEGKKGRGRREFSFLKMDLEPINN